MSTVEQQLTDLFEQEAAGVTPSVTLLTGSLTRSRQRRVRRQLGAVAATAAVAVAAFTVSPLSLGGGHQAVEPAHSVRAVAAPALTTTFPFVADYLPAGTDRHGQVFADSIFATLPNLSTTERWHPIGHPNADLIQLQITTSDPRFQEGTQVDTTVRGHAAKLERDGFRDVLIWQEAPHQWAMLLMFKPFANVTQLRKVAEGLQAKADTRTSYVTMTTAFPHAGLASWGQTDVQLTRKPYVINGTPFISVQAFAHGDYRPEGMTARTINGHHYLIGLGKTDNYYVLMQINPTTDLFVGFGSHLWKDQSVDRVLQGLGYTGPTPARCQHDSGGGLSC